MDLIQIMSFWAYIKPRNQNVEGGAQRRVFLTSSFCECIFQVLKCSIKSKTTERTDTCIWEEEKVTECLLCVQPWAEDFHIFYTCVFVTTLLCTINNRWRNLDLENRLGIFTQLEWSRTRLGIQLSPAPKSLSLHSFPLMKMLNYAPRCSPNAKASKLCPKPPAAAHSCPHSAWEILIAPYCIHSRSPLAISSYP